MPQYVNSWSFSHTNYELFSIRFKISTDPSFARSAIIDLTVFWSDHLEHYSLLGTTPILNYTTTHALYVYLVPILYALLDFIEQTVHTTTRYVRRSLRCTDA